MRNMRKVVGVSLAVALVAALAVYMLVPKTGPNTANVVTNEPQSPPSSGTGTTGGGGTQTGGGGTTPTPHVKLPKLHGQNSHGPKHAVCVPVNEHVQGLAQYQGANWYRGECSNGAGANPQGHAYGHAANGVYLANMLRHLRIAPGL